MSIVPKLSARGELLCAVLRTAVFCGFPVGRVTTARLAGHVRPPGGSHPALIGYAKVRIDSDASHRVEYVPLLINLGGA